MMIVENHVYIITKLIYEAMHPEEFEEEQE